MPQNCLDYGEFLKILSPMLLDANNSSCVSSNKLTRNQALMLQSFAPGRHMLIVKVKKSCPNLIMPTLLLGGKSLIWLC